MSERYRPSNGSEGEGFQAAFCDHCERDRAFRESYPHVDGADGCPILAAALALDINHPSYPKEWTFDRDGHSTCTAFTTDPSKPLRCDKTMDLFA